MALAGRKIVVNITNLFQIYSNADVCVFFFYLKCISYYCMENKASKGVCVLKDSTFVQCLYVFVQDFMS